MEHRTNLSLLLTLSVTGCCLLPSCQEPKSTDTPPQICTVSTDTVIYLQEGEKAPSCKINLDFSYLKPTTETDTISSKINATIQKTLFGKNYEKLVPEQVLPALAENYIQNYKTDVKELFDADMHNGMKPADVPAWYNYEYQLDTEMTEGWKGIWNYTLTNYRYTGGAHPNTEITCLNIDPQTGTVLKENDVFNPKDTANICKLIMNELIKEANRRLDTDTITSLDGLQSQGILLDTYLYIPDNFLLRKENVTFYYNRYEIAPYSAGDFRLKINYDDIQPYMKQY